MAMQEEFYETSDLPEVDQQSLQQENFESEHVESVHLDVGAAYQRFKGKSLASDGVDFSDSLVHKRGKGYGGGPYVLELLGSRNVDQETPQQKFNRLHHEINELTQEIHDIKAKAEKSSEAEKVFSEVKASDIAELQHQLKQLQVEQILGQNASVNLADPHAMLNEKILNILEGGDVDVKGKKGGKGDSAPASDAVYELYVRPDDSSTTKTAKMADVESRLAKMELLVGPDNGKLAALTGDSHSRGVVDAVEYLNQKLQMLDLNHIDAVDARLGALLQKLNQVNDKKKQLDGDDVGKVNELFELMKKWDGFCSSLPDLVARMQSLQELHEQALQFSQSLTQLDGVQQQLTKTFESDSSLLNELRNSLSENMNFIRANCENIEKRIKALQK